MTQKTTFNCLRDLIFCLGTTVLGLLAFAGVSARANADEALKVYALALNNLSHEQTTCSAYFNIAGHCLETSGEHKTGAEFTKASENLMKLARVSAEKAGVSDDALLSRLQIELKSMRKLMKGTCMNISSITGRHTDRCIEVNNDPIGVLKKYIANGGSGKR